MIERFDEELGGCAGVEDVGRAFAAQVAVHGFTVSAAGAFIPTRLGPETIFFFRNWPQAWVALYAERNFVSVDFSVAEARRRLSPFTWREAHAERSLSKAEEALWDEAHRWGWEDGFSVPIHGPGGYFALVNMGGPRLRMTTALRIHLQMLAILTHDRCRALSGLAFAADPEHRPSARELDCMRWVAAGKTDVEIAAILGVSQTTVKSHVESARRKLGAGSRSQAVALMILNGLL